MKGRTHALAQQLTGKQTLEECSVQELKQLAQRYPYFAPAQFLLLQKLRQDGPADEADAQYKKAILYHPNPLQFDLFIASGKFFEDGSEPYTNDVPTVDLIENENNTTVFESETQEKEAIKVEESPLNFITDDAINEPTENRVPVILEQPVDQAEEQYFIPPAETIDDTALDPTEDEHQPVEIIPSAQSEVWSTEQINPGPSLKEEKPIVKEETSTFSFEPYHTVDYFASQGIKISAEELPKDKLGKQMKSFTEWLKSMKRLPVTQLTQSVESTAEKKVESMADHSVSDSEVVTEAMAEVWAKQGNADKALDIYNKLVLLNPSKRAYFAAKIETLKHS